MSAPANLSIEHRNAILTAQLLDEILQAIQDRGWDLGTFLRALFSVPPHGQPGNTIKRSTMLSYFLRGRSAAKAQDVVELMYACRYSRPPQPRNTANRPASSVLRADPKPMARWCLREWAIAMVEGLVSSEAKAVSSKAGGFHLSNAKASWDFMHRFSMEHILASLSAKSPTILRLLVVAAIRPKLRLPSPEDASDGPPSYATYLTRPVVMGQGKNRRNPFIIVLVACMMLFNARNMRFTAFQKLIGVWLFSHTAQPGIYAILGRIGLSVSYSATLQLLRSLSLATLKSIREHALTRAFLAIYDNINRMFRSRDPDLGEKDVVHNGTAATYVELEDCNPKVAFDPRPLHAAQESQARKALNVDVLLKRVDWVHLNKVFALHCVRILVFSVDALASHQQFVQDRFRTTLAVHRMRPGRKTKLQPLATSDHNEGNTAENAKVLDDIMLRQLGLSKDEVGKALVIVGGDQSTVEKLRTLKKFLASCPHGYSQYGWVLPLIQLWHMGWSDLERILNTHWGKSQANDISSFKTTNNIMGRKVQDVKRPDYYPAQHLVFDNLKVEVLDCWRCLLDVTDLSEHFRVHTVEFEDLLKVADTLVRKFMSNEAYELANTSNSIAPKYFPVGKTWQSVNTAGSETTFTGDRVFANGVLRRRDSMLHMEYQYGLADGDIGRGLKVMAVWPFTFAGSGRNKYANELLELTCNFEFEYSAELQEAIKNNWLCNLSGIDGCWFAMDLMQEKNIKQLKKMSTRRDATFGGKFFQDVVSVNIRAFLGAIKSVRTAVKLGDKGGSHQRSQKDAAEKELNRNIVEHGLATFRAGRATGHNAQDDFTVGLELLMANNEKKVRDFVSRTIRDAGALHEAGEDADEDDVEPDKRPMPSVLVGGELVSAEELFESWVDSDSEVEDNTGLPEPEVESDEETASEPEALDVDEGSDNEN
ncbi:hypothetical protein FA95DRAFT_1506196 [Auriscalpium vulgare]|uniref:Uncharacterized protein n=1 Tax=Auriscalpium vulgare TaxID=40419 RepID=A0ACB8R2B9_9AGAM|nr:hypothetical protein FA95DRAFT_1506196 [Auriscalpium vulgare]